METKFYVCESCGNVVGLIEDSGAPLVCCGEQMTPLKANTVDASHEKHVPVIVVNGSSVEVSVGSVAHPMLSEHHISWIYIETNEGGQRKILKLEPKAKFVLAEGEKLISVYAYCNLHGLWQAKA